MLARPGRQSGGAWCPVNEQKSTSLLEHGERGGSPRDRYVMHVSAFASSVATWHRSSFDSGFITSCPAGGPAKREKTRLVSRITGSGWASRGTCRSRPFLHDRVPRDFHRESRASFYRCNDQIACDVEALFHVVMLYRMCFEFYGRESVDCLRVKLF